MKKLLTVLFALAMSLLASPAAAQQGGEAAKSAPAAANGQQPRQPANAAIVRVADLHIPHVSTPPKIGDYLEGKSRADELRISGFRQREPQDGDPATQPTTAYLSYDDKNLYVVFVCKDERSKIRAHMN